MVEARRYWAGATTPGTPESMISLRTACLPLIVLLTLVSAGSAVTLDATWLGARDGAWDQGSRWTSDPFFPNDGSPNASNTYSVLIDAFDPVSPFPYTVLLDRAVSIESLHLDSLDATLVVDAASLSVSDSVLLSGGGLVATGALLSLVDVQLEANSAPVQLESSTLELTGQATLNGSAIVLDDSVLVGGTWVQQGGSLLFSNAFGNTLDGTTLIGDLELQQGTSSTVHIRNGASFTGTARIGTLSTLWVDTDSTFSDVVVEFDGPSRQFERVSVAAGVTLEIDALSRIDLFSDGASFGSTNQGRIINHGLINVSPQHSDFQLFFINPDEFENFGMVEIHGPSTTRIGGFIGTTALWSNELDGLIDVDSARVDFNGQGSNLGTIIAANGSELRIRGTWDNDGEVELIDSDLVFVDAVGTDDLGTISGSGISSIVVEGILDNRNGALAFVAPSLGLRMQGGSLVGGTVSFSGGASLEFSQGTTSVLDAVEIQGDLDLTSTLSEVELLGGARFSGLAKLGTGSKIGFSQTIGLGDLTVVLDDDGGANNGAFGVGGTSTLTLGPATLVQMRGGSSRLTSDLFAEGDGVIVNRGRIEVDGSEGEDYTIDPDSFVNFGSVDRIAQIVSSGAFSIGRSDSAWTNQTGGSLAVEANRMHFDGTGLNLGSISASAGSDVILGGKWDNDGTIEIADSQLTLDGAFETEDIGSLSLSGTSTLHLRGTLDNTDSTLRLDTLGGLQGLIGEGGTIVGGQIVQGGSAGLQQSFKLDGTSVQGDLDLIDPASFMSLSNGALFNGTASLGRSSILRFDETIEVDGIVVDSDGGHVEVGHGFTLTLGPTTVVNLFGRRSGIHDSSFSAGAGAIVINRGLIRAFDTTNLEIRPKHFENQGTISVENGAEIWIGLPSTTWTNQADGEITATSFSNLRFQGDWSNRGTIVTENARVVTPMLTNEVGGRLRLSGSVIGDFDNAGELEVGGVGQIGSLAVTGDLTLQPDSVLTLEIGDASNDALAVDGGLQIAGTLELSVLPAALGTIGPSDEFVLVEAVDGSSGSFSNVASGARLEILDGGGSFEVRYGEAPDPGRVIVKSFLVPEPTTLALSITALLSVGVICAIRKTDRLQESARQNPK